MKIKITAEILVDKLLEVYDGEYDKEDILELVEQECHWLVDSYIFATNVEEIPEDKQIVIVWHIDEVKQAVCDRYDACINNSDAFKVLEFLENDTKEITYQLIDEAISHLLNAQEISLIDCEEEADER